MKLKKKSYIISNKQIAIKRMGTKSNRKKINYENDKRKTNNNQRNKDQN
jgi:hypothetical protein